MDGSNNRRKEAIRAFISIEIPDEVKDRISAVADPINSEGIRCVSKDNMHITLFFLGSISRELVEKVNESLEGLNTRQFSISLNGVGAFTPKRPRIIFAGIEDGRDEIMRIYKYLSGKLENMSIKIDNREYSPHTTIARISDNYNKSALKEFLEKNSKMELGSFMCSSIRLRQSILTSEGPIYSDIYVKSLQ